MTLNKLKLNEFGKIKNINCSPEIKQRFTDLGFITGCIITPVLNSPSGNIRAYYIKDTLLAIRDIDSSNIIIDKKTPI